MLARAAATASTLARRSSSSRFAPAMATAVPHMRHLSTATAKKASSKSKSSVATPPPGGQKLATMTAENPHIDVVKYEHKNRTWTLNHVDYFSKALAIGFTENGLQPGDVVLSWLPEHFSEQASTVQFSSTVMIVAAETAVDATVMSFQAPGMLESTVFSTMLCISQSPFPSFLLSFVSLTPSSLRTILLLLLYLHMSLQMVLQFACSKAGMVLYTLDPALATTDPDKAEEALAAALTLTKANVLVSQEAGSDVNFIRLASKVIPELRVFDFANGMPFVTPRFPHLRFPIQTGFDQDDKAGWLPLRHMIVPSDNLDTFVSEGSVTADTPLAGEMIMDAATGTIPVKLGPTLTNQQVVASKVWPTYVSILEKNFHEVPGVGVIF
jgi:hypothetical protein